MAEKEVEFYGNAKNYWETIPPTIDGMLGGFPEVSTVDVKTSLAFLRPFLTTHGGNTPNNRALDCGAGIGRVTKYLLTSLFNQVDMVELNQTFLNQAQSYLGDRKNKVDRYICSGLQDFVPESGRYNVIWCQWVLGHLTDEDFVAFFTRCKAAIVPGGLIVIKENVTSEERDFDQIDSSYTRPMSEMISLIKRSGLKIIKTKKQEGLPPGLFAVYMFAMK